MLQAMRCSTTSHRVVSFLGARVKGNNPGKRKGKEQHVHVARGRPVVAQFKEHTLYLCPASTR